MLAAPTPARPLRLDGGVRLLESAYPAAMRRQLVGLVDAPGADVVALDGDLEPRALQLALQNHLGAMTGLYADSIETPRRTIERFVQRRGRLVLVVSVERVRHPGALVKWLSSVAGLVRADDRVTLLLLLSPAARVALRTLDVVRRAEPLALAAT